MAFPKIEAVITADTKQAEAGLSRVERGLDGVASTAKRASGGVNVMGAEMQRAAMRSSGLQRGIQNASFQVADFAVMVGGGVDASKALAMQLPQLLGGFGALGAVLGAVVAVGVPVATVMKDMADSGKDMTSVFGTLQPLAQSIAGAFSALGSAVHSMAEAAVNNVDRILVVAGTAAAFFAGKWVVAFAAARVATFSLSASLVALRTAIIRTGIGALLIGIGEGIYQFTRLAKAAGGFGEAMSLLAGIATETWDKIKRGTVLLSEMMGGAAMSIQGVFLSAFATIAEKFAGMTQMFADGLNSLFGTNLQGIGADAATSLRSQADYLTEGGAAIMSSAAGSLSALGSEGFESIKKMRDLLAGMKEERITLPDIFGGGEDDAGGGKNKVVDQIEAQRNALEALRSSAQGAYGALGDFVQQFAGKSKAAAIAAIAIQKGLSIAQIIANTAAAQMRALAELGPIAGPPMAAKIGAYGKLQAGLVAATGLAQAMNAGGGASGGGSLSTPSASTSTPETRTVSEIRFLGNLGADGQTIVDIINSEYDRGNFVRAVVG